MNQRNYNNALCADEKSSVARQSFAYPVTSATGFLLRLSHPNLIISRLKGKCSEYERHLPDYAVYSALQTKRQRSDARNENGKLKIEAKLIRLEAE